MWLNRQRYNNLHKQQDQSLTLNPITVIYLLIGLGVGASLSAKECGANFSYILIPYNIILWPYELGKAISAAQEYFNAKIDLIKRDKYGEHAAEYYDNIQLITNFTSQITPESTNNRRIIQLLADIKDVLSSSSSKNPS